MRNEYLAGRIGLTDYRNEEICDGGREVVLGFACIDAVGAAQRLDGAIIATVAGEQWTPLVNRLHRGKGTRPLDLFSGDVVLAATESVETWIIGLLRKAVKCSSHRGSDTVDEHDIFLAGRCADDLTVTKYGSPRFHPSKFDAIVCAPPWGLTPGDLLAELDVATQERIMRKLARRAGVGAYDGSAYERLWRLILLRLCVLLERVDFVYFNTTPKDWRTRFPTPESWARSKHRPSIETLTYVLQNGSGPIDRPPPCNYRQLVRDEDDGSFRSDDCPDTDDDDDSSIGDESVPPEGPGCLGDRLSTLIQYYFDGCLTEAEFARAKALEAADVLHGTLHTPGRAHDGVGLAAVSRDVLSSAKARDEVNRR